MDYSRPTLNMYADLAVIGIEYANGRMTRDAYMDAAISLGLSRGQAELRAQAYDTHPLMASCT